MHLLVLQVLPDRIRPDVVRVQLVDDFLVAQHPRVGLLRRFDLPDQQLAEPGFGGAIAGQRRGRRKVPSSRG